MCGGGKGVQQTSQQTSMPSWPAALAYNQAMGKVAEATSTPFQKYSSDPTAYVASLTPTQTGAIQNVTGLQGMTTPYYQAATGLTAAGAAPVSQLTSEDIQRYMSPFMSQVVDPVTAALKQQQGQQLAQQQAEAIKGGAFGQERSGIQRQTLRGQQQLGLGQALSPLYQTGYGQALQTAQGQQGIQAQNLQRMLAAGQQFGGLGTAAQQAALQQASAQLQAGTLQQQTETAQKQALYNEFQKQRMYPLQVAQMYAQTAGALGPLMGSTGMGYQQMPFFGGFAADGGAIEGYDNGLGAARMGGAVDEPGDYARGGYAYGGIGAHLAYTDPSDPNALERRKMDALLASQQASFQPSEADVPSFPTGSFQTGRAPELGTLPERREGILGGLAKAAIKDPSAAYEKASGLYSGARDYLQKQGFLSNPLGGTHTGASYAGGGDVEDNAMSDLLSHPVQASRPQQMQAPAGKQGSGLLGGLMKTGASLAANYFLPGSGPVVSGGLSALGMAGGGRAAFQEGGPSEDGVFKKGILGAESAHRQFDKYGRTLTSPKGAEGISQIMPGTGPEAAQLAGLPYDRQRLRTDEEYNTALGNAYYNKQLRDFGTEELAAAAYNAGPGRVRQALARAEREGGDVMSYLPAETRKYVPTVMRKAGLSPDAIGEQIAGLGPRERSMMAEYPPRPTTEEPGPSAGLGSAQVREKGFMERTQEHPESLILPVLQGLGAMAGSKNRYALGALAEGLGAGAGSYMDTQQKMADIAKRQQEVATESASTREREALADRQIMETKKVRGDMYQFVPVPGTGVYVIDKSDPFQQWKLITDPDQNALPGSEHIVEEARRQGAIPPSTGTGTAAPAGGAKPPADVSGKPTVPSTEEPHPWEWQATTRVPKSYKLPYGLMTALTPGSQEAEIVSAEKAKADAQGQAAEANRRLRTISEMEHAIKSIKSPVLEPGKFGNERVGIARAINDVTRLLTGKDAFNQAELSSTELAQKDAFRLGQSAADTFGGHPAASIVQESVVATPSMANTRMGYMRLLSGLKAAAQYEKDRNEFINDYAGKFKTVREAETKFSELNPPWRYAQMAVRSVIHPDHLKELKKYGMNYKDKLDPIYGAGTTKLLMEGE